MRLARYERGAGTPALEPDPRLFALVELLSTRAGDVVRVEIERMGAIENRVVEEQPTGGPP